MSVGYPLNKATLDSRLGYLTVTLRDVLDDWVTLKAQTDSLQDSDLTTMGYTAGDITAIRGIAAAMATLRSVAHGQATQSPASDFFFFSTKVTGVE
jgi:hypothetical protein